MDCSYCGAPTPNAQRARADEQARQERATAAAAEGAKREQNAASEKMELAANKALILSLVGLFLCFIPILQIVSVVFYARARSLAKQLSVGVPVRATTGFVLSSLSLVVLTGGIVWAIVDDNQDQERADARIAALDAQARAGALQASLDWATACALAEIHALKDGYGAEKGRNLVHFDCVGKIMQQSGRPMLEHLSFRSNTNDKKFDVAVCFEHGAKWFVSEMNESRTCTNRAEPAAAAAKPTSPGAP
jgi:hypothetical protein